MLKNRLEPLRSNRIIQSGKEHQLLHHVYNFLICLFMCIGDLLSKTTGHKEAPKIDYDEYGAEKNIKLPKIKTKPKI